jgi:ubiquinone/menaquinone biosynthesis C-methylase UbiE
MDRRTYFDDLSARWDSFTDGVRVRGALGLALQSFDIHPDEHIIDLGCGTGNLSRVLCAGLGSHGRVTAVDISPAMISVASARLSDERVRWLIADAAGLPVDAGTVDRVICYSAWPHFPEPATVAREIGRVLRVNGSLHIMHLDGREKVNAIHTGAGGVIGHDILPPAVDLVVLLREAGFDTYEAVDTPEAYCVSARWNG